MLYNIPPYQPSQQSMALSHDFKGFSAPNAVYNPFSRSRDHVSASTSAGNSWITLHTKKALDNPSSRHRDCVSSRSPTISADRTSITPYSQGGASVDSQHALPHSEDIPPAYTPSSPSYQPMPPLAQEKEPRTTHMYLFFLGFVCPILWLIGTFMMSPPHKEYRGAFDPYMHLSSAEKAVARRNAEERHRRWKVEMKWAKRCMWASIAFVCLGLTVGMSIWGGLTSKHRD